MKTQEFGAKIRELRHQARMTQKELADKVGIDFTYLSKIENRVMPPPSEKVILKLAEALNADKDELIALAGKVPADIAQLLSNREALQFLRSQRAQKMIGASNKKRGNLKMVGKTLINSKGLFNKSFSKIAIAAVLVLAVVGSLWFAAPVPVKAVDATLPSFPTVMYSAHVHSFYAQVDINNESIPIINLRVNISGPTSAWAEFNVDGSITNQSGATFGITPVVVPYYGYGYRYGYGYGYQPPPTGYRYFSHTWGYGYGYGYGLGTGLATQAKYLVTINTTGMTLGSYTAQLVVNTTPAPKKFLSPLYSFTLATAPGGGGGAPPPAAAVSATGSVDLTAYVDAEGNTTAEITLSSADGQVTVVIPEGTKVLDAAGNPVSNIYIIVLHTPPPPPGYTLVGPAYNCGPDGTTFEPVLSLTFAYDPADIPDGVSEEALVMAYWDGNQWVTLPTTVNTVANSVTASVAHFTPFTILAKLPPTPAAFTVGSLNISPAEADIGETVTISAVVTNTGELAGSYTVTLKVDGVVVATEAVTVDGGATQEVTFTTTKDAAGTYAVDVSGLVGEFVVKAAPAPPAPPTPTPPAPPAPALNWWLIGGIIAAVIVIAILVWYFVSKRRIA